MLAIALIPSITLLVAGVVLASYLIIGAVGTRSFATKIRDSEQPSIPFFVATQEERRVALGAIAGNQTDRAALATQRSQTDAAAAAVLANLQGFVGDVPPSVQQNIATEGALLAKLPQMRQQADAGQLSLTAAYDYYNQIIDQFVLGLAGLAQDAPDAQNAYLRLIAVPLFTSADEMERSDALSAAGVAAGGLSDDDFRTYTAQVGAYHAQLLSAVPNMIPEVKAGYDQLVSGDAWHTLTTVENSFLRSSHLSLQVAEAEWHGASRDVGNSLMGLFVQQSRFATGSAIDQADRTLVGSLIAAAIALLLAIGVFFVALRLSSRLISRLTKLRADTLDIADVRMPQLVMRVRAGEEVDLDAEVALLDHGDDEIGQVAEAFNKAQQTAIAAALDEAKMREGTKAVFLNIAHRSQVIVHRQLKVLDQAERKQEDPDQLDTLFQLDHLSTRARRNAENLIILGGGQPGRQWRNPVGLAEVVRGASAETEDFARVKMSKLPSIAVNGLVVGDLVHLLAELIDNATAFSPPTSKVEIRGNVVGRGVVIEVEDQGLGIESEAADEFNELLRNPPDFGIMALSTEPRLGLFVVARLAARHGIAVTLRESAYGGTRAIVLVKSELLGSLPEPEEAPPVEDAAPARRPRHRTEVPVEPAAAPAPAPVAVADLPVRPRVDMFRPQPPAWPAQEPRPVPQQSRPPQSHGPEAPGRPPLPQRRRQQNLVPQLMTERTERPVERESAGAGTPEQARSRLSAFQQGTRRARDQEPDLTQVTTNGEQN
ncbi:MAG: two-component system sensor kinase [Amycolatopsis sp.]|uniref:sensor histidine kinase n=1 Tax=Amycolatopsis sp. TaxID=37632 RepID=UPI0026242C3D|nr:nitrate- and nitrite sensing domain-containing protein [Amycolatopsis sp.]MCU1684828.1 two-component system sensor kinase [Amycolatopsis sp.]